MNKLITLIVLCASLLGMGLTSYTPNANPNCVAHVPGSISPNGDGINDFFFIEPGCKWTQYHLQILDNQSQVVFQSEKVHEVWDGTYQGKPLPQGFYQWKLKFVQEGTGNHIIENGEIVLVR
ncbi:MAG: gliding motility-associated C-terminal domain-containing protein [Bacteroidota bacterium]